MTNDKVVLRVENLKKSFGDNEVLKGVSFEMKEGETKVIIGPSGTGKSTLLACINMRAGLSQTTAEFGLKMKRSLLQRT